MRSRLRLAAMTALALCPATAPVAEAASEDAQWTAVYIGASWMQAATRVFVEDAQADLDADIFFTQRNKSIVASAVSTMKSGQWDRALTDAEIIVVNITETTREPGFCVDTPSDTPFRIPPEQFRADVEAFLDELTQRADPETTLIRIVTHAILPHFRALWIERGVEQECLAGFLALNDQWIEAAAGRGIPVLDMRAAWNGPDGRTDAPKSYFGEDLGHLAPEGARAAAELLRAMGYAPLAP